MWTTVLDRKLTNTGYRFNSKNINLYKLPPISKDINPTILTFHANDG